MRYRLISLDKTKKIIGKLNELKPISAYMYEWKITTDYLYLQCQTKKGGKWRDYTAPIYWYELQHKKFMDNLYIMGFMELVFG